MQTQIFHFCVTMASFKELCFKTQTILFARVKRFLKLLQSRTVLETKQLKMNKKDVLRYAPTHKARPDTKSYEDGYRYKQLLKKIYSSKKQNYQWRTMHG